MANFFMGVAGFLVALQIGYTLWTHRNRDSTDGEKRSGLILYTDHATGVQYVGTVLGGITPRINIHGNPYRD